jgi:flagellar biosynthesis protein FlhF
VFVKRYIAKDMPEAMEKIRKDLGPDAVILSNRRIHSRGIGALFKKKLLEVVVAYEPTAEKPMRAEHAERPRQEIFVPEQAKPAVSVEDLTKLDVLNVKIEQLQGVVKDFTEKITIADKDTAKFSPEVALLYDRMIYRDVNEEIARRLAVNTQEVMVKMSVNPNMVMEQLVLESLGDPSQIRLKKFKTNVIILVGPTGVGKTTTVVKLAGLFTCGYGLKVGLVNTDTYRIAAQEQIKTYADIMDIPLCTVYSPDELEEALKSMEERDVVLIDTAGKSPSDEAYKKEIRTLIEKTEADEVLLTISVVTGFHACKDIITNYSFLKDYKIIITKMDEVSVWGNVLNIVSFAGKPLTYLTIGQNVPDDIEQADTQKITSNILGSVSI